MPLGLKPDHGFRPVIMIDLMGAQGEVINSALVLQVAGQIAGELIQSLIGILFTDAMDHQHRCPAMR